MRSFLNAISTGVDVVVTGNTHQCPIEPYLRESIFFITNGMIN